MRLSDAVFNAADEFHISRLMPLYMLTLKNGYGHMVQPRFRCEVDNTEMSVIEMNATALSSSGQLINIQFDHTEREMFQKLPVPESHDTFIVYLEQSGSQFDEFEDKGIPYKTNHVSLIFKPESTGYSNPDAIAVARFKYQQCWTMDNTFIPPCITLKANADLWNLTHTYHRILSDLQNALVGKLSSEAGKEVLALIPVISSITTEVGKERDEMSPKHLVTLMQQCISAFYFTLRSQYALPESESCKAFVDAEFLSTRIDILVNEGIRLTQLILQQIDTLKQAVHISQAEPQIVQRTIRQPRTLDTSSERKSFKSRK